MIKAMGFAGYFLIVADFIRYAKSKKIPVGPGRGSGADLWLHMPWESQKSTHWPMVFSLNDS